jgi:hypothetical protein
VDDLAAIAARAFAEPHRFSGIEQNHAHSFWGLCARLYTKLTTHTLCVSEPIAGQPKLVANQRLGLSQWLTTKSTST